LPVANPSYLGVWDQEVHDLRPAWAGPITRPHLNQQRGWGWGGGSIWWLSPYVKLTIEGLQSKSAWAKSKTWTKRRCGSNDRAPAW
jgi:hypothetical protein